ncbi:hypothetical protein OG985_28510 [Streptomyces sp. NBC_00289]|uniref:hypothetical protein n=1 Tax=Streptomyces sp. NBC_00289 TaxID=2975703 RepID=UPI00324FB480
MDVTITVRVCDVCERRDRPAIRYTLTPENGTAKTRDLCAVDVAPVEKLFGPLEEAEADDSPSSKAKPVKKAATAKKVASGTVPRRRASRTPVMTMEQIEKMKAGSSES